MHQRWTQIVLNKCHRQTCLCMMIIACFCLLNQVSASAQTMDDHEDVINKPLAKRIAMTADKSNKAFHQRVLRIYQTARKIRIDGVPDDWQGIPAMNDAEDFDNASRDIVRYAIAPMKEHIDVMIDTRGRTSMDKYAYYLLLDLGGNRSMDVRFNFDKRQVHALILNQDENKKKNTPFVLKKSHLVHGQALEARIYYQDLIDSLPEDIKADMLDPDRKPFMRSMLRGWDGNVRESDYVKQLASYRLLREPYNYNVDSPKPQQITDIAIEFPFKGRWLISQGPFGAFSHQGKWAYDMRINNPYGFPSEPRNSKTNSDYFAYGQPLYSPVDGVVTRSRDGHPDAVPRVADRKAKANTILIQTNEDVYISLVHLLKGSIRVEKEDHVKTGDVLARLGNSGFSTGPHLDLMGYRLIDRKYVSQPMAFQSVRVSINEMDNDPWARDLYYWEIREGFYVEAMKQPGR